MEVNKLKKKFNPDNLEESKLCPFCMGELSIDATKCNYCGEELEEDRERTRERLRREGEDNAKGEVRRQIQDRLRENKKSDSTGKHEITQKSSSKVEGVKKWWTGQSTGVKALVVLCVGVVAVSGMYLASGINQGAPYQLIGSNSTSDSVNQSSSGSSHDNSKNVKMITCSICNGTGKITELIGEKVICPQCNNGYDKYSCKNCSGTGYIKENVTIYKTCPTCKGKGKVKA
jgi:RecJ-like exonuclease